MVRRSLVGISIVALVAAGLAASPTPAVSAAVAAEDPGLLEPDKLPVVPAVPLDDPDYEIAESDKAPSVPLPHDVEDLPEPEAASVDAATAWSPVPDTPVDVRATEPTADAPGPEDSPRSRQEDTPAWSTNVPAGAQVEVELSRPDDLQHGVLLLDLRVGKDAAGHGQPPQPSASPENSGTPSAPESPESPESPQSSPELSPDATAPEPPAAAGDLVSAGGLRVRISYADYEQIYGGRWSDRLGVVAYPECFATTPEADGCSTGTAVETTNHAASNRLTFTTLTSAETAEVAPTSDQAQESEQTSGVVYALLAEPGKFDAVPFSSATQWQSGTGSGEFTYSYPFELPQAQGGATPSLALSYSSAVVDAMTAENSQASVAGTGWSDLTPGFITRSFTSCEDDQPAAATDFDDRGDLCWTTRTVTDDDEVPREQVVEEMSLSMNGRSSKLRLTHRNVDDGDAATITDEFRLYDDPGWHIERRRDATASGGNLVDDDRERWVVATPDGTEYHFGPQTGSGSKSAWTVPVFGNDPGEPCHAAALADSACQQAWQWSLDRVVDPSGNEIHYNYEIETNFYDQFGPGSVEYVRAGRLVRIEYGFNPKVDPTLDTPRQVVEVGTTARCLPAVKVNPNTFPRPTPEPSCPISGSGAVPADWPDVPLDLVCTGGTCAAKGPAFFSTRRYQDVKTFTMQGAGGGTKVPVASYQLGHTLPDPVGRTLENDGGEQADLWLQSVQVFGHVDGRTGASSTEIPHVYFEGDIFDNRVDPNGADALKKFRIFAVRNELGGRIDVAYGHQNPCDATYVSNRARWDTTKECFAAWNDTTERFEWFHKYVVTRVAASDDALHYRIGSPSTTPSLGSVQITDYSYSGTPAWRYQASRNIKIAEESWNDWRGYEQALTRVRKVENQDQSGTRSVTRTVRFRGMNGSRRNVAGDTHTDVTISTAEPGDGEDGAPGPKDQEWLNGLVAETTLTQPTLADPDGGTLIERNYTGYGTHTVISPRNGDKARIVYTNQATTTTGTSSGTQAQRRHTIRYGTWDGGTNHRGVLAGSPRWTWDQGNVTNDETNTNTADDLCTTTTWETNNAINDTIPAPGDRHREWIRAEEDTRNFQGPCPDGAPAGALVAHTERFYDDEETLDDAATPADEAPLTRGLLTRTTTHTGPPAEDAPITTETDYDDFGRVIETRDGNANRTLTEYNPAGSGLDPEDLLEKLTVTQVQDPDNPGDPDGPDLVTRTTLEPAKGLPTRVVDPNSGVTRMTYDGLGRPLRMFAPRNTTATPTIEHSYLNQLRDHLPDPLSEDLPARVLTTTQIGAPGQNKTTSSYTFFDGWGKPIETQQASPVAGRRLVTSTGYDDRGLVKFSTAGYSSTDPGLGAIVNPDPADVPDYSLTTYDAAQRPVEAKDMSSQTVYRTATTAYLGDATISRPPGAGATVSYTDVWDRPTRVQLHTDASPDLTGLTDRADHANYAYTPRGELKEISKTLPGSATVHQWGYAYDWAGRKTEATDPDTGRSTYTYDPAGNLTSTETFGTPGGARQSLIRTEYDDLNRPVERIDDTGILLPGNRTVARWTYDTATNGLGKLASTVSTTHLLEDIPDILPPNGLTSWDHTKTITGYDPDGNPTGVEVRYPSWLTGEAATSGGQVAHTYGYDYTATGAPAKVTYPASPGFGAGFSVDYNYEISGGRLATMRANSGATLADTIYNAIGQRNYLSSYSTAHNTLIRSYGWEPATSRPQSLVATRAGPGTSTQPGTSNAVALLALGYEYDTADNPLRVTAAIRNTPTGAIAKASWCYSYDGLNRLTRAHNGLPDVENPNNPSQKTCTQPAPGTSNAALVTAATGPLHNLGYEYSGDRLSKVKTPGSGTATGTVSYQWGTTASPHRTTRLSGAGTGLAAAGMPETGLIGYDPSGRATSQPGGRVTDYNHQGQPVASVSLNTQDQEIASQYAYDADGMRIARRTVNLDLNNITATTVYLPGGTEITKNLTAAPTSAHRIATPDGTPLTTITPAGSTWDFADAANSIRLADNPATTAVPSRPNYYPHGQPTTTPVPTLTGRGYLNKPHDPNGDLRLDQRNYTPTLNILTTPDPLLDSTDPQSLNPYVHARNNPIALQDPTGLRECATTGQGGNCPFVEDDGSWTPTGSDRDLPRNDNDRNAGRPQPVASDGAGPESCPAHQVGQAGCGGTIWPTNHLVGGTPNAYTTSFVGFIEGLTLGILEVRGIDRERDAYRNGSLVGYLTGFAGVIKGGIRLLGRETKEQAAEAAANTTTSLIGRQYGLGTVVESPGLTIKGFQGAKTPGHALNQIINRGIRPSTLKSTVASPKVVLRQGSGNYLHLSDDAAVVLRPDGQVVTAYGRSDFREHVLDILADVG